MRKKRIVADIQRIMARADEWFVIAHEKPDGDTLGCTAAIASLGLRLDKKVIWCGRDEIPPQYAFIAEGLEYERLDSVPWDRLSELSVVICADVSTEDRAIGGLDARPSDKSLINIDHHRDNKKFGTVNWVDVKASATGEMITELISKSDWGMSLNEARALYAAIVSDNGGFKFSSTSLNSHRAAIVLLKAGASPYDVARELDQTLTPAILKLWSRAFAKIEVSDDGRVALCGITQEDFDVTGTEPSSTENLVNFLLRIRGVELAALCREDGNVVRVSLRANPPYNVRVVAAGFGGGGHDLASGCKIESSLTDAVRELRNEMERHVETWIPGSE